MTLPQPGQYAVAMCFLPREAKAREIVVKQFEHFIKVEGQMLLGWRDVPTDPDRPGQDRARQHAADPPGDRRARARTSRTRTRSSASCSTIRKQTQNPLAELAKKHKLPAITQLLHAAASRRARWSTRACCWRHDVGRFYRDLQNPLTMSAIALVHQRFSTNTFPSLEAGASLSLHRP